MADKSIEREVRELQGRVNDTDGVTRFMVGVQLDQLRKAERLRVLAHKFLHQVERYEALKPVTKWSSYKELRGQLDALNADTFGKLTPKLKRASKRFLAR
jgi:hypothetical protein